MLNRADYLKKVSFFLLSILIIFAFTGLDSKSIIKNDGSIKSTYYKSGTDDSNTVELKKVTDNIWIHISYSIYNDSRAASNGLIVVSSKGLILIDTPWNNAQTRELLKLTKTVFKKNIAFAVITHAHADRIGGINTLLDNKIDVRCTAMTVKEAIKNKFKKPTTIIEPNTKISFGNINLETFYPGPGHTVDNITVWFSQFKLLYGGCLIKSLASEDLGNIEDANVQQWPISVEKVLKRYPDAKIVIPGHGNIGNLDLVKHTLELAKNAT